MNNDHIEELEDRFPASSGNRLAKMGAIACFIGAALLCARYAGPKSALAAGGWESDWDVAVHQSKETGKPALILFTADWCPACKQFEGDTLANEEVQQYLRDNYTLVLVDLTKRQGPNNERAREFGVRSIPTLILYDQAGKEKTRGHGMPTEMFLAWLKSGGIGVRFTSAN